MKSIETLHFTLCLSLLAAVALRFLTHLGNLVEFVAESAVVPAKSEAFMLYFYLQIKRLGHKISNVPARNSRFYDKTIAQAVIAQSFCRKRWFPGTAKRQNG